MSEEAHARGEGTPVRVTVLPDSFKGSARATDVAAAMARGAELALSGRPGGVRVSALPFADGGEGTLDALLGAWGSDALSVATTDAIGRPTTARYGLSPDRARGVVEAAEANGLPAVADAPPRPRTATTRGVGPLVGALLDAGVEEILLCIGGSATTDGGAGLLAALGARFLDSGGEEIPDGGGGLAELDRIDLEGLDPRARSVRWRIACDVTNPLVGERGAAAVFGPQKGADAEDVRVLEAGLNRLADVLAQATGADVRDREGMGAAGGLPSVLTAVLGAELLPGARLVAQTLGAERLVAGADIVVTGEGRFDAQSLDGKVVDAVRRMTPGHVPVLVVAGSVAVGPEELERSGITAALSIARGPSGIDRMREEALEGITWATYNGCRLLGHRLAPSRAREGSAV